jgi:signal transduction histidine kinase
VRRLIDRLRTTRLDLSLALVFLVAGLAQTVVFPIARSPLGELYVLGSTLPLAWRRTRPLESALFSSVFWLIPLHGYPLLGYVVVLLQFFALGSRGTPRIAVAAVTAWAAVMAVAGTLLGPEPPVGAIGAVLAVVGPVLVGQVVARLRQQNAELARLAEELRIERGRAEAAAVGAERARIAQELHDVVGHELTLIAIQAEAAGAARRQSPDRAVGPVEAIRTTAHRTLAEIRGVLEVLAPQDPPDLSTDRADVADLTDLADPGDLAELARRASAAGIANSLRVRGEPWRDHPAAALAVNRIVRECLTNAARHAPGETVDLSVEWNPNEVQVHASNPTEVSVPSASGRGLTGLRHRAELLGGRFDSAVRDGRFQVTVSLPCVASIR